jgi:hypothetical protein
MLQPKSSEDVGLLESYDICILLWKSCARWIRVSGHNSQRKRLLRHAATSAWCNLHEETLTSVARHGTLVHRTKELYHFYWERLDARDWSVGLVFVWAAEAMLLDSRRFHNKAAMVIYVRECLWMQAPHFYRDGVLKLVPKWEKCILVLVVVQKIMKLHRNKGAIYIYIYKYIHTHTHTHTHNHTRCPRS